MSFHDLIEISNELIDQYHISYNVWLKAECHHFSANHEFLSYIELLDGNKKVFSTYFNDDEQQVIYSYKNDIEVLLEADDIEIGLFVEDEQSEEEDDDDAS